MRFNGNNDNVEESKDLILYNSQAFSLPVMPQLWYTSQPFVSYYFTSPPSQYSPFIPNMSYYSTVSQNMTRQDFIHEDINTLTLSVTLSAQFLREKL